MVLSTKSKQDWHDQVAADPRFADDPEKLAIAHEIVEADGRFNEHRYIRRIALQESIRTEGKYCPHAHQRQVVAMTKWVPPISPERATLEVPPEPAATTTAAPAKAAHKKARRPGA